MVEGKGTWVVPMVPPNLTGDLHLGHALMMTVEDAVVRVRRQEGHRVVFVPGVDHAGIGMYAACRASTGFRPDLPVAERLEEWSALHRRLIRSQMAELDLACDWGRHTYTMDAAYASRVQLAFRRLGEAGLVYRGQRVLHWCPGCATVVSDMEAEPVVVQAEVAVVPLQIGGREVAVDCPDAGRLWSASAVRTSLPDPPYSIPGFLEGRPLAVLPSGGPADASLVVPAHDPADHRLARDLGLPVHDDFDAAGLSTLPETAGMDLAGLNRWTVERLDLRTVPRFVQRFTCGRCGSQMTFRLTWQWFVRMRPLAEPLLAAIETGSVRLHPDECRREALQWLRHVEDWCVSRQIPWGQRVPASHCPRCDAWSQEPAGACGSCGAAMQASNDVLDTWFSSSLWPLAIAGWPDGPELADLYPASLMTTGRDILFFWLLRTFAVCGHLAGGRWPAPTAYLHGLVVDGRGEKMSKSRGNVTTLHDAVERHGADAVRGALLAGCRGAARVRMGQEQLAAWARRLEPARRLARLAAGGTDRPDLLDRWCLGRAAAAGERFRRQVGGLDPAGAMRELERFLDGPLRWYCDVRERQRRAGAAAPVWTALPAGVGAMLEPACPALAARLAPEGVTTERPAAAGEGLRAVETLALLAAELGRLRGALGLNTHTVVAAELSPDLAGALSAEPWVGAISPLTTTLGGPPPGTVGWSLGGPLAGVTLHLDAAYAPRLRAEARRQLRGAAKGRLRALRRAGGGGAAPVASRLATLERTAAVLRGNLVASQRPATPG